MPVNSQTSPKLAKKKRQFAPVWLDGMLTIVTRHGKHGEFRVAKLETGVGEFAVKDQVLEQYDPGVYTGKFLIGLIQAKPSFWRNSVFVEVRAYLDDLIIDVQDQLDDEAIQSVETVNSGPVLDPLEVERSEPVLPDAKPVALIVKAEVPENKETAQLIALGFVRELDVQEGRLGQDDKGDQVAAILTAQPVALDSKGQDREVMRKQIDYLKTLGYRFVSSGQYWAIPAIE